MMNTEKQGKKKKVKHKNMERENMQEIIEKA